MTKINISIPRPCHEDWQAMTPENKGRFCDSCQKKVFDFTSSSDREIINAFQKDNNLCGRFLTSQLDRNLVKPKEKSTVWLATTTALISLIGLNETTAQQKAPTEQTDRRALGKFMVTEPKEIKNEEIMVSGIVSDKLGALPGANVIIKGTDKIVQTDFDGKFQINANPDDVVLVSFVGMQDFEFKASKSKTYENIVLQDGVMLGESVVTTLGAIVKKRTFFGRIFYRIGNLFR